MIDLRPAIRAQMQVDRLFLPDGATVAFRSHDEDAGWQTLRELGAADAWTVEEKNKGWTSLNSTESYLVLSLLDEPWVQEVLDAAEVVVFAGRRYKFSRLHEALPGSEPVWELKLELISREAE